MINTISYGQTLIDTIKIQEKTSLIIVDQKEKPVANIETVQGEIRATLSPNINSVIIEGFKDNKEIKNTILIDNYGTYNYVSTYFDSTSGSHSITIQDGILIEISENVNDSETPKLEILFEKGKIHRQYSILKNLYEGNFVQFYDNGKIEMNGLYKNGCRQGIWIFYHRNGEIKEKGQYSDCLKFKLSSDSIFSVVNLNNKNAYTLYQKSFVENYIKSAEPVLFMKNGTWFLYDDMGTLIKTEEYKDGVLIK